MKTRSIFLWMILILTWTLTACSAAPVTPEAASATALKFLQARSAGDAGAMLGLLTERARKAIPAGDIARHLGSEAFTFGTLGQPAVVDESTVQVPVADYRILTPGQDARWPEFRLTLVYEENRWRVAWTEPLAAAARRAYENSQYGEELELARTIGQIDPYSYRGPLERHFAYRGLKRLREAEVEILRARELATPYQAPDVEDSFARFKLALGQPGDAAALARGALDKAAPYVPNLYSHRWQADTLVTLGRALLARGDRAGAEDALKRAEQVDPANAGVAMLRRGLAGQ